MANEKEKIAFFDFCETLVPFQSADRYIHYVCQHYGNTLVRVRYTFWRLADKIHFIRFVKKIAHITIDNKIWMLHLCKGLSFDTMQLAAEEFYEKEIVPNLIHETTDRLHELQKEGWRIVLISGGYDIYLRMFAKEQGISINDVICSKLQFKRGVFTGKMEGIDCMGENKIELLEQHFDRIKIESQVYTDSITDMPLLQWVDKGIVVRRKHWAEANNFEQIIW